MIVVTTLVALTVAALFATLAASAQADPQGHWSCYSTAVHVDGATDPVIVASAPCGNSSQSSQATPNVKASPGSGAATNVKVNTTGVLNNPPVPGDHATGQGSADSATIVSGSTVIRADGITTQAAVTCDAADTNYTLTGASTVADVSVNGNSVALTGGPQDVSTPAGTLHIDESHTASGSSGNDSYSALYQRALRLETPNGNIIIDEAAVAGVDSPCVNGPPPPPPAPAAPIFGCWASAISAGPFHPAFIANPSVAPCTSSSQNSASSFSIDSGFASGSNLYATTTAHPNPLPAWTTLTPYPTGTYVTSAAGAQNISIGLNAFPISANSVSSDATAACTGPGTQALASDSRVHGLVLNGNAVADQTAPKDITLPNGIGTLHLNWIIQNGVYVERRALWLQTFTGQDVILGDSLAGSNISPC